MKSHGAKSNKYSAFQLWFLCQILLKEISHFHCHNVKPTSIHFCGQLWHLQIMYLYNPSLEVILSENICLRSKFIIRNSELYGLHLHFCISTIFILVVETSALVLQITLKDPGLITTYYFSLCLKVWFPQ